METEEPAKPPAKALETPAPEAKPPSDGPQGQPSPQGPAAPPPAAQIVVQGTKTEREMVLERELRERETRLSEVEDENRRLKDVPKPKPPRPEAKKHWLSGATFFED